MRDGPALGGELARLNQWGVAPNGFVPAYPTLGMAFDPGRSAVVVVDMQKGFCHPDGSLYAPGSEDVIEPIAALLDDAREAGASVIFTRDVHPPEQFEGSHYYDEFERWGEHLVEGSWEAEVVDGLAVEDSDHVLTKHTYDAFYETELEGWLRAHGIEDQIGRAHV